MTSYTTLTGRAPLPSNGQPLDGQLIFRLSEYAVDGSVIHLPASITAVLGTDAALPANFQLFKNSEGTVPTYYTVKARWREQKGNGIAQREETLGLIELGPSDTHDLATLLDAQRPAPTAPPSFRRWVYEFETRDDMVAAYAAGFVPVPGMLYHAGGVPYLGKPIEFLRWTELPGLDVADICTPLHSGAIGDGVSADGAFVSAADAAFPAVELPEGKTFRFSGQASSLSSRYSGGGVILDDSGKRGRFFSQSKSRPAVGNHNSVLTAFDGDFSDVPFPVEHRITGAATLGQPTTGYLYTPETTPHYTYLFNSSGHNESTTGNGGRTGATAYRTTVFHSGQGDAVAYNASVFVTGQKPGASGPTGWLANPAGVLLNGEVTAGSDGVYLNNLEINLKGQTYDVAGVGCVFNFLRNNATGALGAGWDGIRFQSSGTQPVDAGLRFVGNGGFRVGVNFVEMVSADSAAIAMAAGQRIYLDAENPGGGNLFDVTLNDTWIGAPTPGGGITFVANNNPVMQLAASASARTQIISNLDIRAPADTGEMVRVYNAAGTEYVGIGQVGNVSYILAASGGALNTTFALRTAISGTEADALIVEANGALSLPKAGALLRMNGTQVVGQRRLGWNAPTGVGTRSAFATSTVTTQQLAERVKALIDDLIAHGLIGA